MSIELQEARNKLDILEEMASNSQLILTDLFSNGVSDSNFLYQVNIKGKYILDYLIEHLKRLQEFEGTILKANAYDLDVYFPALKYGEFQSFQPEDKIIEIDMNKKTYRICKGDIQKYLNVMETKYELETCELSDFWKKYEDFNFKNRLKNAYMSLFSTKKLHIRINDFIYTLFVPKEKIENAINREQEKVNKKNEQNLKYYNERIGLQNFYKENAPMQINMIHSKQHEIAKYLVQLGYKEDNGMSY